MVSASASARTRSCGGSTSPSGAARWSPCSARTGPASRPSPGHLGRLPRRGGDGRDRRRSPSTLNKPQDAMDAGIQVIYQEFRHNLFPQLSVAENLYTGDRSGRHGRVWSKRTRMVRDAAELLTGLGMTMDPTSLVQDLSVPQQQMLAIAKAIGERANLLILDEPTAALDQAESEALFAQVRRLRDEGVAIIYISPPAHRGLRPRRPGGGAAGRHRRPGDRARREQRARSRRGHGRPLGRELLPQGVARHRPGGADPERPRQRRPLRRRRPAGARGRGAWASAASRAAARAACCAACTACCP